MYKWILNKLRLQMDTTDSQILVHKNTLLTKNEYLNELMVEDLQCRESEWDRVHEDEILKQESECNALIQHVMYS